MTTPEKDRPAASDPDDDHVIPPALPVEVLGDYVLRHIPHEEERIRSYVEMEAEDETVTHLEKVKTESILGRKFDAWDVRTDKGRWWVITNPTNLYSQDLFPSLDYTLSFHVGLMMRVEASREPAASDEERDRLAAAWRKWSQAADAVDYADEAEEFQACGMRCRECLLELIRVIATPDMVPQGEQGPKRSDFVHWSELIAEAISPGSGAADVRSYLKAIARATWQLVNWLTHAGNARPFDGHLAVDATAHVLQAFGSVLVRHERGIPDRCPACSSYRITRVYRPELEIDPPYVSLCEVCGWSNVDARAHGGPGDTPR